MRVDVLGVAFDNVTLDEAVDRALAMLEEVHFPQELVATRSAEAFLGAVTRVAGPVEGL